MAPPPPPPELMQDPLEEVLLRIPPDDPASLLRAALVCKRWLRIVSGGPFRRRFRSFHRTPPMLGAVVNQIGFVPTSTFHFKVPPELRGGSWMVLDARHGRVLIGRTKCGCRRTPWETAIFSVWDPITGEKLDLPNLPELQERCPCSTSYAVLCAATGCNHIDCSGGPSFLVVVLEITDNEDTLARVYSSKDGEWSDPTFGPQIITDRLREFERDMHSTESLDPSPGVLAGHAVYFLFHDMDAMVKFDLKTRELELIDLPVTREGQRIALITTEDGSLGFAVMKEDCTVHLWSRVAAAPSREEASRWALSRVIDLKRLLPVEALRKPPVMLGSVGVICLYTSDGEIVSSIDIIKSSQPRKMPQELGQKRQETGCHDYVVPFMSFCTPAPAQRAASEDEEPMWDHVYEPRRKKGSGTGELGAHIIL